MVIAAWLLPSLLTLAFWGISSFLPKLTIETLSPLHVIVYSSGFFLCGAVVLLALRGFHLGFDPEGAFFGVSIGILGTAGWILYLFAFRHGTVSGVTAVSALYPVIATVLAFFVLGEGLTPRQTAGIVLGICALVLTAVANDRKNKE